MPVGLSLGSNEILPKGKMGLLRVKVDRSIECTNIVDCNSGKTFGVASKEATYGGQVRAVGPKFNKQEAVAIGNI